MISVSIGRWAASFLAKEIPVVLEPSAPRATPSSERRQSPRLPVQGMTVSDGPTAFEGGGNVGLGGVLFCGRGEGLLPSTLTVSFTLPGSRGEIRAQGEVLYQAQDGERLWVRMRFTELPVEGEKAIARYIGDWLRASA